MPPELGGATCNCYESCDQLMAMMGMDSCTSGTCTAGGATGDPLVDMLLLLFMGGSGSSSAGICL